MNIELEIVQHKNAAEALLKKATDEGRNMTESEATEFDSHITEAEKLKTMMDTAKKNTERLEKLGMGKKDINMGEAEEDIDGARNLGERFTKSAGYQAFKKDADADGLPGKIEIRKTRIGSMRDYFNAKAGNALTTGTAHVQNERMPMVDASAHPEVTLLDYISRGTTNGSFEYLQVQSVTRNTGIVPENTGDDSADTVKPQSSIKTSLETAKVYDYADGYTVTNQLLQDDAAFASFLQNEFDYSFNLKIADILLNGTGSDGQPKGLLNTTGVQAGDWSKTGDEAHNLVVSIRQALTLLRKVGANANAVLLNPADAEKIDLLEDANKRFLGNGPFAVGPSTIWSRPIVECDQLAAGKVVIGDFKQLALLDRTGLTVEAFNQHKDYASRNLTYIRAELRAAQVIWRPSNFVVLEQKA